MVVTSGGGGGGGGGTPTSFIDATNDQRPANPTGGRSVSFTTEAGHASAITNMIAGDVISYTGASGALTITKSTGSVYKLSSKNPSSTVVIDYGCSHNRWDASKVTSNYVAFSYTGTGNFVAYWVDACSNINIYGGDFTTGNYGGFGLKVNASTHDVRMMDGYFHLMGNSGIQLAAATSATPAVASAIYNFYIRAEVTRWAMNPALDTHIDKGTGFHALIAHGSLGDTHDYTAYIYCSNPLQPGESSAGQTWSEGGGGCGIEAGNDVGTNEANIRLACYATQLKMIPNGTNVGSTGTQTAGNVINLWGNIALDGMVMVWIEGVDNTGTMVKQANGSYYPGSPAISVLHGRHTNINQSTAGSNVSVPYPTTTQGGTPTGIVYSIDCT